MTCCQSQNCGDTCYAYKSYQPYQTSEFDGYTLMQLYAILQSNGVAIETSMLNKKAMLAAIKDNDISLPQKYLTTHQDASRWTLETGILSNSYYLVISHPVQFVIMKDDMFIAPNKRTYSVENILLEDPSVGNGCIVILRDVQTKEAKIWTDLDIVFGLDCTEMVYIKSGWLDMRDNR